MNSLTKILITLTFGLIGLNSHAETTDTTTAAAYKDTKSEVVIYRPKQRGSSSGINYRLYLNGQQIEGRLRNNSQRVLHLEPGHYSLVVNDAKNTQIDFQLDAGETEIIRAIVEYKKGKYGVEFLAGDLGLATRESPEISELLAKN